MLLNRVEKWMMNNPARAAVQRHFEARRLLAMGGPLPHGAHALEVGCGRGVGAELLFERFGAARVDAFDLDPQMVGLARERLARFGDRARVWVGNATDIDAADGSYDAVFDFGIVHHVPEWRDAVAEIARVLRPGGRLYSEEILASFILHPVWRRVLAHPTHDRFDASTFVGALEGAGLRSIAERSLYDHVVWVVADKPARD